MTNAETLMANFEQAASELHRRCAFEAADDAIAIPALIDSLSSLSVQIAGLSYRDAGAMQAKAASAYYWYQHPENGTIRDDIGGDGTDVSTAADAINAMAQAFCPEFAAKVDAMRAAA